MMMENIKNQTDREVIIVRIEFDK